MSATPTEAELPPGYLLRRGRCGVLAVDAELEPGLAAAGFGPDGGETLAAADVAGRRPLGVLEAGGERLYVRRFHHGGLARGLGPRFYLDPMRPFRELRLAHDLRERGIRTPHVVAARARRHAPFSWRLDLVTRPVEGTIDGAEALNRIARGEGGAAARHALARGMGELCGRLHAAAFLHADLHPKNLLVSADLAAPGEPWVLDLDRSRFAPELDDEARWRNLARLWRWLLRRERRAPLLRRTDAVRFLRAYERTRGAARGSWRRDAREVARRERRGRALHRTGWAVEALLGSGHERRDGTAPGPAEN